MQQAPLLPIHRAALQEGCHQYLWGNLTKAQAAFASGGPSGWMSLVACRIQSGDAAGALQVLKVALTKVMRSFSSGAE